MAFDKAKGGDARPDGESPVTVRAVSRAIAVLRAFTPEQPHLGLADIAGAAQLDKGTTRRLLLTLIEEDLVWQDPATQRYGLALGVVQLAAAVHTGGLREEARPVMGRLAQETGATVFLSVADRPGALCLERARGADPVQVQWWEVGKHMPWNCGAGPRLLLAYMAEERVAEALTNMRALTPHSEMRADRLRRHLRTVAERGWELTQDDVVLGLSAAAVPVRDRSGTVVAALSIGSLTHLVVGGNAEPKGLPRLCDAAAEITARAH